MLTTCDQRNNHASRPAAPTTDGGLLNNLLMGARTINIHSSAATGREQDDDASLNNDADQDQEQDFPIDHHSDRHAEYQNVCNIINSALEMIEDDDLFL
jgi:hypothetical protein